jgi:Triose-phosphate Transporter family
MTLHIANMQGACDSQTALSTMLSPFCRGASKLFGPNMGPQVVTLLFIAVWYGLNIAFNLRNKTIFNYFPFPWTVSAIHVVVGAAYCGITYLLGFKEASFGRVSFHRQLHVVYHIFVCVSACRSHGRLGMVCACPPALALRHHP